MMSTEVKSSPRRQDLEIGPINVDEEKGVSEITEEEMKQAAELAGAQPSDSGDHKVSTTPIGDFGISQNNLASMTRENDLQTLKDLGGPKGLAVMLKTSLEKGIPEDEDELLNRKNAFGANTYPRKKGRSFLVFLWEACIDLERIILMVVAIVSLASGIKSKGKKGWYHGGSILMSVIPLIIVKAICNYLQSLQFQNRNDEKENIHKKVIRGGRSLEISIFDIVVGDVVPLHIGDQVPIDGILISGHYLAIVESSTTGKSRIVHKDAESPFIMSGCKVADGSGVMLVTSVGINTEWGKLMASISDQDSSEETPLQVRLNGVARCIRYVGLPVAAVVLIILIARYFAGLSTDDVGVVQYIQGEMKPIEIVDALIKIVAVAVTIVVVAKPEGRSLPMKLTLVYSTRKMRADKQALVISRPSVCETMGSATTICSDMTGTLTLNKMKIVSSYVAEKKIERHYNSSLFSPTVCSLLIEGIAHNTTGSVFSRPEGDGEPEILESPTEIAILEWGVKIGMVFGSARSESTILHVFPFNSEKKRRGVAVLRPDSQVHVHWKGAAEIVLGCCTRYFDENDSVVNMDDQKVMFYKQLIEDMAAQSLRCVALAYRPCDVEMVPTDEELLSKWELPEDDLVLLAIVGIKDPCRPGVKDAVELCRNAGVKVRMVTGEHINTAKAIALECGILESDADASELTLIEGTKFRELTDDQRDVMADTILVMGRSSPNDKLLLVQALRRRGHIVAVTGVGTNGAPALHEADIGLAMGRAGTEVAKESSDIIILDDNFSTVVKVVRCGRSVYANIQKFIQFRLTVNVAAVFINVVAAAASGNVPLDSAQLLWVNIIMDILGALAFATEPPTDHLMERPPVGSREPLITNIMWRNLLIQAIYQATILLFLYFRSRSLLGYSNRLNNTLIFNAFVFCQVFNEFNARKPDEFNIFEGVTKDFYFMAIIVVTITLQFFIIEFLEKFENMTTLSWEYWLQSVAIGCAGWPLAVLGKLIPVPKTPLSEYFTRMFQVFKSLFGRERIDSSSDHGNGEAVQENHS